MALSWCRHRLGQLEEEEDLLFISVVLLLLLLYCLPFHYLSVLEWLTWSRFSNDQWNEIWIQEKKKFLFLVGLYNQILVHRLNLCLGRCWFGLSPFNYSFIMLAIENGCGSTHRSLTCWFKMTAISRSGTRVKFYRARVPNSNQTALNSQIGQQRNILQFHQSVTIQA